MKQLLKYYSFFLIIVLTPALSYARDSLRLPAIFSDKMVLQQQSTIPIWGWAQPGEKVRIKSGWQFFSKSICADENGRWQTQLKTPKAGGSYQISIKTNTRSVILDSVLIGEVWLCAGQSNMEMSLKKTENVEEEIVCAHLPQIRLFKVAHKIAHEIQSDCRGEWQCCTPETAADFSAISYYFGKEIHQNLNVPVGLIQVAWGGVPVEVFMREDFLRQNPDYNNLFAKWETWRSWSKENPLEYDSLLTIWQAWEKQAKFAQANSLSEPAKPELPEPMYNLVRPHRETSVLYNGMLAPVVPFGINGIIWCQGTSNRDRAYQYRTLFPDLIRHWRQEWQQGEFPFYYVQNAPYEFKDLESAAELREAQMLAMRTVHNTGMVVTTDAGDFLDIHPHNKKTPGIRLANWALANTYNVKNIPFSGPLYRSCRIAGKKVIVTFDYSGSGLIIKGEAAGQFVIAGQDSVFHPAEVSVIGSYLEIYSNDVPQPVAARYNWFGEPKACLFNKEDLPASPFRTDDWPGVTHRKL